MQRGRRLATRRLSSPTLLVAGSLDDLRSRYGSRLRWWMLLSVMVGTMAAVVASTIVNVAVPDMSRHFALTPSRAQWLSAGFMAAMALAMLTTPLLLQRFGYRHTYSAALVLLGTGGLVGGSSPWFELVMAMRVVEGLAAGVLQPIPAIIVMRAFGTHEQGRAIGVFGFGVLLAPAIGPSIGGVLVEWFGWRSIFFFVVPVCAVALPLARRFLPDTSPGGEAAGAQAGRFDWPGLALVALALFALLNGIVQLRGSESGRAPMFLFASAVLAVAFLWRQCTAAAPLLSLSVFGQGALAPGSVVAFFYGMALYASTYLVPVFMQSALGLPASLAGAVLLPAGILLAMTNLIAGRLADRLPAAALIASGVVMMSCSFAGMWWVGPLTALTTIMAWAALGRIGLGMVLPALSVSALRGMQRDMLSQGASAINFVRQLGGAVGISVVGVVLEWRLAAHGLVGSGGSVMLEPARLAAYHETFILLALTMAVTILPACRMPRTSA